MLKKQGKGLNNKGFSTAESIILIMGLSIMLMLVSLSLLGSILGDNVEQAQKDAIFIEVSMEESSEILDNLTESLVPVSTADLYEMIESGYLVDSGGVLETIPSGLTLHRLPSSDVNAYLNEGQFIEGDVYIADNFYVVIDINVRKSQFFTYRRNPSKRFSFFRGLSE